MVALPGITIRDKIYESANSLVYRGIRDDLPIVIKMLKQDYPCCISNGWMLKIASNASW
jgi:hypothetical protein